MSASRPWLASRPAVALPFGDSNTSGASLEFSTWLAVERICSKLLSSYSTVAPVSSSKISMAFAQAMPTSLSVPSKCQSFSVFGSDWAPLEHPVSSAAVAASATPAPMPRLGILMVRFLSRAVRGGDGGGREREVVVCVEVVLGWWGRGIRSNR